MEPSKGELFEALEANRSEGAAELARENAIRKLQLAELKELLTAEQVKKDTLRALSETVALLTPPPLAVHPGPGSRPQHTWVLVVSDLQHGQKNSRASSGGVFEQSSEVSREQMRLLWRKLDRQAAIASSSIEVERLAIFFLGDMHEGDGMRPGQATQVDSPVMVQTIEVVDFETELVNNALARFPLVDVYIVGGNHDRNSAKPGTGGLGELAQVNNYAWLGGEVLRRLFSEAISDGRLTLTNNESWFGANWVCDRRFVYEHGASFKSSTGSYGGISYYSIANAAGGYQRMLDGADVVLFGHFHQPMVLPMRGGWAWQVVNGAFPPSSEFIQSQFKGVVRPTQWLLDFHPEYGMVGSTPLYVELPGKVLRPGDFWASKR